MKKFLACILLALTVVCAIPFNAATAETQSGEDVYSSIDAYLSQATQRAHIPATSVTIVDKESVLLSKTYGKCGSADVPFLLGSVSKSFTAVCIMQLVENGKINLDDNISAYLPTAKYGAKITVKQLLNHTSGLGEHQNFNNYKILNKQGEHVYANVNYTLLGKIIEAVSGTDYGTYVTQNVFKPLNMTRSAASREESEKNGLIQGYRNYLGVNTAAKPSYPKSDSDWISLSAGYLSASTNDLGKYLQMYLNEGNEIISQQSIDAMFYDNNVSVEANIPYAYGFGWNLIKEPLNEPVLRHSGLVETGMSCIYILPERQIGIAIAVNVNDYFVTKDMMDRIDWSIALMLMGEAPNEIGASEYAVKHFGYDMAYIAVLIIACLPLCLLGLFIKRLSKGNLALKTVITVLLHLVLPSLLLALSQMFFATPLWVACNFVPDLFITIVISSILLYAGGIAKAAIRIFYTVKKRRNKNDLQTAVY
ncbi:MAG: beta-lactamase family protein [Clostridia bacterium]|nr:beta-lactamase family protein [Clostridia bacterium]